MKSALEIAMEKANKIAKSEGTVALTDEQKQEISNLRKEYEGKIAECEIMLECDIKKVSGSAPPEEARQLIEIQKQGLVEKRKELNNEMEEKIEKIRSKK